MGIIEKIFSGIDFTQVFDIAALAGTAAVLLFFLAVDIVVLVTIGKKKRGPIRVILYILCVLLFLAALVLSAVLVLHRTGWVEGLTFTNNGQGRYSLRFKYDGNELFYIPYVGAYFTFLTGSLFMEILFYAVTGLLFLYVLLRPFKFGKKRKKSAAAPVSDPSGGAVAYGPDDIDRAVGQVGDAYAAPQAQEPVLEDFTGGLPDYETSATPEAAPAHEMTEAVPAPEMPEAAPEPQADTWSAVPEPILEEPELRPAPVYTPPPAAPAPDPVKRFAPTTRTSAVRRVQPLEHVSAAECARRQDEARETPETPRRAPVKVSRVNTKSRAGELFAAYLETREDGEKQALIGQLENIEKE
ncbi:MAG: hypothetical protein LBH24_04925 [Clostridiales bacterium]|jgi:hypothetical protein|nr:hypothetical protein [Clostridiales bacterium]